MSSIEVKRLTSGGYLVGGKKYDSVTQVLSPLSLGIEYGNANIAWKALHALIGFIIDGNYPVSYRDWLDFNSASHSWGTFVKFLFSDSGKEWITGTVTIEAKKAAQRGTLVHRLKDSLAVGEIKPDCSAYSLTEWLIEEIEAWNAVSEFNSKQYDEWKAQHPESKLTKLKWMDEYSTGEKDRCYVSIEDVLPFCQNLCAWWEKFQPNVVYVERILVNKRSKVAGTCDGLMVVGDEAWLFDIKTSNSPSPKDTHAVQLGGYWDMTYYYDGELKELDWPEDLKLVVLQVTPDKVMRRYVNPKSAKHQWLGALRLYRPKDLWIGRGRDDLKVQ